VLLLRCSAYSYGNGADEGEEETCDAAVVSRCHFIRGSSRTNYQINPQLLSSVGVNPPRPGLTCTR